MEMKAKALARGRYLQPANKAIVAAATIADDVPENPIAAHAVIRFYVAARIREILPFLSSRHISRAAT